jgi:hypothetical protein
MDHDQNALSPTALVWDLNGELCSADLERLLAHLQAEEVNQQKQTKPQQAREKRSLLTAPETLTRK